MTVWCMRIACWIPKAIKHMPIKCNTYCFSTATNVTRRPSMLLLHVASLISLNMFCVTDIRLKIVLSLAITYKQACQQTDIKYNKCFYTQ